MKCLNCGKEVLTEDKFCPFCGKEIPQEEELKPKAEESTEQRKDERAAVPKGSGSSTGGKGQGLKGGKRVWLIGAAFAVCLLMVLLFCLRPGSSGDSDASDNVFYLKDNELYAVKAAKRNPEGILCTDAFFKDKDTVPGRMRAGWVQESEDGKYWFYPSDYESGTFDLYYKSARKTSEQEKRLDTSVVSYRLTPKNCVIYEKDTGDLFVHDLKDKERLTKAVANWWVAKDGSVVMWTEADGEGTYDLYYQKLSSKEDKQELETHVSSVFCSEEQNMKTVVYLKDGKLYASKSFKEADKIDSNVARVVARGSGDDFSVYYLKEGEALRSSELFQNDIKTDYTEGLMETITSFLSNNYPLYDLYCYNGKEKQGEGREPIDTDVVDLDALEYFLDGNYLDDVHFTNVFLDMDIISDMENVCGYAKVDREELRKDPLSDWMDGYDYSYYAEDSIEDCIRLAMVRGQEKASLELEDMDSGNALWSLWFGLDLDKLQLILGDEDWMKGFTFSNKGFGKSADMEPLEPGCSDWIIYNGNSCYLKDEDLYCNDERIAYDVKAYGFVKDSKALLILTDYDESSGSYTLQLYQKGEKKTVAEDVYGAVMLDGGRIALLVDYDSRKMRGDLLIYDGKKTITVDDDVSGIFGDVISFR